MSLSLDSLSEAEDGAAVTGTIQLGSRAEPDSPLACLNTKGPNTRETRIWAFLSPNPQLQYDVFSDGTSPLNLQPEFGANPDGTG